MACLLGHGPAALRGWSGEPAALDAQALRFIGIRSVDAQEKLAIRQLDLRHHLLIALLLDPVIVGFWDLDFIHEPELHGLSSL